jgi:hypothetical protein
MSLKDIIKRLVEARPSDSKIVDITFSCKHGTSELGIEVFTLGKNHCRTLHTIS